MNIFKNNPFFKITLVNLFVITMSINVVAQSSSTVIADAKVKTPGYNSYEYEGKRLSYAGIVPYYRHTYYGRENAGFACAPQAIIRKGCWIEYWSGGKYKNHGYWLDHKIENMPTPDFGKLQTILTKGGFDPLDQLNPSTLYDLLEIHGYELVQGGEITWRSENKVRVSGTVTLTKFYSNLETQKCVVPATFTFERSSCGQSFVLNEAYFSLGGNGSSAKVLETKSHTNDEMKTLQLQSVGRKRAEAKAKEKWDGLAKINIPKFEHFHELVFFARNLFMNGSREEVESFLYKTSPSYRFQEGSQYLISYRGEEAIGNTLKNIFEGGKNYRSQYCDVLQHKEHQKKSYSFYNIDESASVKFIGEQEKGVWKLEEAQIYLSDNIETAECPAPVELELLTDNTYGFSIKMPKGYTSKKSGTSIIYEANANGVKYVVIANKFGAAESNNARYEQAKSNWNQHSKYGGIATYEEEMVDWKINDVTGRDIHFFGSVRGGSGGAKFGEWYRSIYLGEINFEIYVRNLDCSEENTQFMNSFSTTLSGSKGEESPVAKTKDKYQVGDYVLVNIGTWEAAVVEKINSNNTYNVLTTKTNKSYTAKEDALQVDSNPTKILVAEESKSSTDYKEGDKVMVRISQTAWTPGVIKEKKSDGRYLVHCTEIDKQYIQPAANLKPQN